MGPCRAPYEPTLLKEKLMTDTTATASAVKAPAPARGGKGATAGIVVSAIVAAIGIAWTLFIAKKAGK